MDEVSMLRLFIALELPERLEEAIREEQRWLMEGRPPVKWVGAGGFHLTLQFLGAVATGRVGPLLEVLEAAGQGVAPFSLRMRGLGAFPNPRRPRVLWAGIEGEVEPLGKLQRAVVQATASLGFQAEARAWSPHLTLGRVREGAARGEVEALGKAVAARRFEPEASWDVDRFALVRSELLPAGARYTVVGEVGLGG